MTYFQHVSRSQTLFLNWVFSGKQPLSCFVHHFLFRTCNALGEETIAKYKFLLHDFLPKFKNAFMNQSVESGKGRTLPVERIVLCISRSCC